MKIKYYQVLFTIAVGLMVYFNFKIANNSPVNNIELPITQKYQGLVVLDGYLILNFNDKSHELDSLYDSFEVGQTLVLPSKQPEIQSYIRILQIFTILITALLIIGFWLFTINK